MVKDLFGVQHVVNLLSLRLIDRHEVVFELMSPAARPEKDVPLLIVYTRSRGC